LVGVELTLTAPPPSRTFAIPGGIAVCAGDIGAPREPEQAFFASSDAGHSIARLFRALSLPISIGLGANPRRSPLTAKPSRMTQKALDDAPKPFGASAKGLEEPPKPFGERAKGFEMAAKGLEITEKALEEPPKPFGERTKGSETASKPLQITLKALEHAPKPLEVLAKGLEMVPKPVPSSP
jgi:hypothetical protein